MDVLLYWRSQYGAVLRTIQCLQVTGHQTPWDSGEMKLGLSGRNMELKTKRKMKNYEHLKYK